MAQNGERAATPLTMPVLAIGGEDSWGGPVGSAMSGIAKDVETVVIPAARTGSPRRRPKSCWPR